MCLRSWQMWLAALLWLGIGIVAGTRGAYAADEAAPNTLTEAEKAAGWRLLFDGKTLSGWRNYRKPDISPGWKVEEGALVRAASGAGDIITIEQFEAFELSLEYNISPGGNSGLMYHVTEEASTPWRTGPEIQIQDVGSAAKDPQKAGWLYQLYRADVDAARPAGQWNEIRILVTPQKCATWLNGQLYYEYVKGSDDWNQRVAKSKFAREPSFGKATRGHICLQDHGNPVRFRNIKIRVIPTSP